MIKKFKQLKKEDVKIAGGKGASLGEMIGVGIPVPDGFVVTTVAYDNFLGESNLKLTINSILDKVDCENYGSIEEASRVIRERIMQTDMPRLIEEEIRHHFEILDYELVAVRSSATAEDSTVASWAGELDSFLNVTDDNLLYSVKNCWSSLFSPRAIFYRWQNGLWKEDVSVAVVVQKMSNADVAGICFTVNPVTKEEDELVIEAGFGLGEAIVGGMATPDTYIAQKKNGKLIKKNISAQEVMIIRDNIDGSVEVPVDADICRMQKLSDEEIKELANLCQRIEGHYGTPQDIEWSLENGHFYIVQSRPITCL